MKALKDDIVTLTSKVDKLEREKEAIAKELETMKDKLKYHQTACRMTVEAIKNDDVRTKFYTGLSTWYLFGVLFNFLSLFVRKPRQLTLMDELFLDY